MASSNKDSWLQNPKIYRPEIDGLRGLAILAVILNHFNDTLIPGGYLGVDIFFVISGYVITSSLFYRNDKSLVNFLLNFYSRRIKRIFPALIIFCLICSFLACFFIQDLRMNLRTGMTSIFGISNLYLIKWSTDYFASSTKLNIFSQTWSLGVEEQFYLIYPFLFWFLSPKKKNVKKFTNLTLIMIILSIISFITFKYYLITNQSLAYYLMPSRFWEIAIGCLTFFYQGPIKNIFRNNNYLGKILISLITLIIFLPISINIYSTFSIVILSSLLISILEKEDFSFKLLTAKSILKLGKLSYSLYLWHWGIIVISKWTIGIHWWSIPFQVLIIYFVSLVSYKYIELPFKNKIYFYKKFHQNIVNIFLLISSLISLFLLDIGLGRKLYLGNTKEVNDGEAVSVGYLSENCSIDHKKTYDFKLIKKKCFAGDISNQSIYFIGDSHTQTLLHGFDYFTDESKFSNFIAFSYGTLFPPVNYFLKGEKNYYLKRLANLNNLKFDILNNAKKGDIFFIFFRMPFHFSENYGSKINEFRYFDSSNNVVIAPTKDNQFNNWLKALEKFVSNAEKKGIKVIVSTPLPEFPDATNELCLEQSRQWFNSLNKRRCSFPLSFFQGNNGSYKNIITKLEEIRLENENLYLFDALQIMCKDEKCNFSANQTNLYRDSNHLTKYAVKNFIFPEILKFIKNNDLDYSLKN